MQKGDPNDALKPCQAGGNQPASALVQGTVQHLIQLQTINSQGQEASRQGTLGVLQVSGLSTVKNAASTIPATQHAVVVTSPSLAQLFTPTSSITGSLTLGPVGVSQGTPIIPVQTNPLQRQLSDQGNLSPMKSVRNVVGHIGSVVPGHDVSMSSHGGSELHQQPLQQSHSMSASGATVHHQLSLPLTPTSSVSASGGTIHHHGQSPIRGTVIPLSNLQRISTMNQTSQVRGSSSESSGMVTGSVTPKGLLDMKVFTGVSVSPLPRSPGSAGPSPRKKLKLEEKPPATSEIEHYRKLILDHIHKEMLEIKENYIEHLSELFFLQNGGSMMDYMSWKKRPTPQLVTFLKSSNLDSDEEDIQERRISDEVRILATSGSNQPLATPVAISTTLPPSVAALSQQGSDGKKLGGRHGMVFLHAPTSQQLTHQTLPGSSSNLGLNIQTTKSTVPTHVKSVPTSASVSTPSVSHSLTTTCSSMVTSASQLHSQLVRSSSDTKPVTVHTSRAVHTPISSPAIQHKQQSITAMYENSIFQGSQEAIVERAKQEAQVMQRVAELRKEGLWSSRKLPKVQEPQRNKAHWDYLLEEMMWLSADFMQERKWKKAAARKVAKMVQKYHQELEQKEIKAEKEEGQRLKKIAGQIAKQVKEFWTNIEKVVQFKQQTLLEEKRKKALDLHLNFIVDQTEKYSSWLTEGLAAGSTGGSSIAGSVDGASDHSGEGGDDDFCPEGSETDDEETIDIEEKDGLDEEKTQEELEALQKESELPLEDILKDLPQEMLEKPATVIKDEDLVESKETISEMEEMDKEFSALDEEDADVEDTIEEQEKIEKKEYSKEINELQEEGDMSMEDLISKYAGAYDSDFDMPESESEIDDTEDEDSDEEEDEEEEEEDDDDEEEDDDEEIEVDDKDTLDVGLEFLMKPAESSEVDQTKGIEDTKGPSKEITDIAAEALSVQPKGYTLETAEVKTTIPFLLKHILREYQHVGLDWMATMYGKKLNGILADEMGLGKTIQTIALLAHLACEKGIWGPHLIVVPTSVMLNWEMELKKWCPAFKILTYYGNHKERKLKRMGWTKTNAFHVCITSYKLVIQDHQSFRRKKWKYFILDEAQNIKNFKSQRWQTLLNFQSQRRLLLTGTPLQNSLMELWSLMHFLMPNVFQSHKEFKEWFANPLTGMIEGSHEYNENLIYRLHKVLRPFLLRRLKADVEKQMPKKYEHVIMCALSKRQRYLYDDFMSQRKTKDTLATGQFMSVINILMQLRKVCNHPSLFDARPIVSPFQTEGIVYHTSSIVLKVFEHNPLEKIDLSCWFPGLVDMERDLPAFIAHRVKKLQTQRKLIEEIDIQPDSPPRPPPGKLKPVVFRGVSPMIQSGRSSPVPQLCASRPASPMPPMRSQVGQVIAAAASQLAKKGILQSGLSVPQSTVAPQITTVTAPLQAKVLPQQGGCLHFQNRAITGLHQTTSGMQQSVTSQPITVQIQQTDQGTRLMIPTGQLSQLPAGFIQIVQTSAGQQIIATSNPSVMQPVISTQNCIFATTLQSVNSSPAITNVASSLNSVKVTSSSPPVRTTPQIQLPTTPVLTGIKPIMRVSPLVTEQKPASTTVLQVSRAEESPSTTVKLSGSEEKPFSAAAPVPSLSNVTTTAKVEDTRKKKSELYMKSLDMNRRRYRKGKLDYLARLNKIHCEMRPVYGEDLCNAVDVTSDLEKTLIKDNTWHGHGHVLCSTVHTRKHLHADATLLSELVHTPDQYLKELEDILERFVFATPTVTAPPIRMHVSHPPPSYLLEQRRNAFQYQKEFAPRSACLGSISTKMTVQFPELRLIQYDCGKLQSLDILLRRLKSGSHRVLIFTQMTKMLDIFEAFLNYHGHRYLRLDGTTKVEKRQVLMDRFNADRRIFCFILSTRSGGLGVNLTGADTVIFYDSDWNPTMDAQAQDRCHRIGQTRDVHIYRLISEKTIEENILKKANQKRLLGDLAIEGGNFTTAFFKSQTIQELFSEPSGLQSLSEEVSSKPDEKETIKEIVPQNKPKMKGSDTSIVSQFEQALGKAEDETDAIAADLVKAEQKAELAEFDESIPWDEREAELRKEEEDMTRAEQELCMLEKELSPIERYAVSFMENDIEPFEDELQVAEEDIENAKKEWELTRLKSLKEEEERRAEIEEDEMLYTYARDDSYSQVKKQKSKRSSGRKSEPPQSKYIANRNRHNSKTSPDSKSFTSTPLHSPESREKSSVSSTNQEDDADTLEKTGQRVISPDTRSQVKSSVKSPETRARTKVKSPKIDKYSGPKSPETRSHARVKSPDSASTKLGMGKKSTDNTPKRKSVPKSNLNKLVVPQVSKSDKTIPNEGTANSESTPKPRGRGRPPKVKKEAKIEPPSSSGPILTVPNFTSHISNVARQCNPIITVKQPAVSVSSSPVNIQIRQSAPCSTMSGQQPQVTALKPGDFSIRQKMGVTIRQPTNVSIAQPTGQFLLRQSGLPVQQLSGISLNQAGVILRPQAGTAMVPQTSVIVRQPSGIPVVQHLGVPVQQQNLPTGLVLVHLVGGKQVVLGSPMQVTGQKQGVVTVGQRLSVPVSVTNKAGPTSQMISSNMSSLVLNQNSNRVPISQIVHSSSPRQVVGQLTANQVSGRVIYSPVSKPIVSTQLSSQIAPSQSSIVTAPLPIKLTNQQVHQISLVTTPLPAKIINQPDTSASAEDSNYSKMRLTNPSSLKKINNVISTENANIPQPWSNANLVIRTRRASLQESLKSPDSVQHVPSTVTGMNSQPLLLQPQVMNIVNSAVPFTLNSQPTVLGASHSTKVEQHALINENLIITQNSLQISNQPNGDTNKSVSENIDTTVKDIKDTG